MLEGEQVRSLTPDELAQHFPQLEIVEILGQGATGALYKARQPRTDRLVALKILPAQHGQALVERFTREAIALAKLRHENIMAIHEVGTEGLCYLLMEFTEGPSLLQRLQAGPIEAREALSIVRQVCEALRYAHEHGVVHGNLTPEHIFLDAKGHVKISDFRLGELLGHAAVDHRADLDSVGLVFYEMLTGKSPPGDVGLSSPDVRVDERFRKVLHRLLHEDPQQRYQHASEVLADLQQVRIELPKPPARKNRRVPLAAAAAFVAVVYGFFVLPALREAWPGLNWLRWQQARSRPYRNAQRFVPYGDRAQQEPLRLGKITRDGPLLSEGDASRLGLQHQQIVLVNAVLRVAFQEYLQLEREHMRQELDEAGHLVTTIVPFPEQFEQLENRLWSKLAQILDEQQQSQARAELPIRPAQASPGFFGWAGEGATIETWQSGATYHWTIVAGDSTITLSAPQLPEELQRFWEAADAG